MDTKEATEFLRDCAFVAFPSLRQWLEGTDRCNDTLKMWITALGKLDDSECRAVVEEWITGTIPPPRFMRDAFVAELAACVREKRRQNIQQQRNAETLEATCVTKGGPHIVWGSEVYVREWLPRKAAVECGELTADQARREWRLILDSAMPTQKGSPK